MQARLKGQSFEHLGLNSEQDYILLTQSGLPPQEQDQYIFIYFGNENCFCFPSSSQRLLLFLISLFKTPQRKEQESNHHTSHPTPPYNNLIMTSPYQTFHNQSSTSLQPNYSRNVSCFQILNFAYPFLHMRKSINKQDLSIQDFPNPFQSENSQLRARRLLERLQTRKSKTLLRAIIYQYRKQFIFISLLVIIDFMLKLVNSLLMGSMIRQLTTSSKTPTGNAAPQGITIAGQSIWKDAGIFFILLLLGLYSRTWVFHYCVELGAKLRFSATQLVYFKTTKLSGSSLREYGIGTLMNIVSNDLNDLDGGLVWVFQLLLLPINLSVATYAIWRSFGYYTLIGLGVLILSLRLQDTLARAAKEQSRQKNKQTDKRVFYCKEMVRNIKAVKMYLWEHKLLNLIEHLRKKEIGLNFNVMLSQGMSKMVSYFSLLISVLSMVLTKVLLDPGALQSDSVYASIGIFGVIRNTNFNGGLNYFNSLHLILGRLEKFLLLKEIRTHNRASITYSSNLPADVQLQSIQMAARLNVSSNTVQKSSSKTFLFTKYGNIVRKLGQFDVQNQKRIFIFGLSGSGKSSLLQAFLDESEYYLVENLKGTLSYVPQEPVLFSGTVRDNITFGSDYDETRFNRVVAACCLDKDIEKFAEGIDTKVAMQGASFSGGQRARIALARALYSVADILILDNSLSALDPKVRKQVHKNIFVDELLKDRFIIFATSSQDEILQDESNLFIHVADQQVKYFGPYKPNVIHHFTSSSELLQEKSVLIQKPVEVQATTQQQAFETEEEGSIGKETVMYLLGHFGVGYKGFLKITVVILLFVLCEISVLTFYKRLPHLHEDTWAILKEIGNYLTMYICLDYLRMYVMVVLASKNSLDAHQSMLRKVTLAKYGWYFSRESELLNLFSNHVGVVDRPLPSVVYDVVKGLLSNAIYIISMCIVTPIFIPLAAVLIVGFWLVKSVLRQYIRKCKIFELKYRSPVYNKLGEVFAGATVIRAFGREENFNTAFHYLIHNSEKTYFAFTKMSRFFDLILELIVFLMIVFGLSMTILFASDSSNLALSIFTLISMTSELSFNIRQTLIVELSLISLQKMLSYQNTPQEPLIEPPNILQESSVEMMQMPKGDIIFDNVKMKYPGSNNYCLNGLNLTIKEGEKVAIMGRTGAGKSSVFLALYRLFDIEPESSIRIGGKDIRQIDLYTLRKWYISSSAQDPICLPPLTTEASPSQLKYESIVNGQNTPIKLLDEPFANIDPHLENKIWESVRDLKTVLAVVHSGNLKRWDRIVVLVDGKIGKDTANPDSFRKIESEKSISSSRVNTEENQDGRQSSRTHQSMGD